VRFDVLASMLLLAACGRIAFDASSGEGGTTGDPTIDANHNDGSGSGSDDALPLATCMDLPTTCGPTGTMSCCDSPIVSGGTFFRGYDRVTNSMYTDITRPATISSFRLDRYEVTVSRFRQFVAAGLGTREHPPNPGTGARALNGAPAQGGWDSAWDSRLAPDTPSLMASLKCDSRYETWTDAPGNRENHPITCVTWYEAMAFCAWDGGFLPTEAEWHYATSGGNLGRAYAWSSPAGSTTLDCSTANFGGTNWPTTACDADGTKPVGWLSPAGDDMWGHADLGGNVWEWVLDWYGSTYPMPCSDCARLAPANERVLRGGSFGRDASLLRAANRSFLQPVVRYGDGGIRCARAL
jgi:formylglycine-generating enzyme required for sulfatase activity